MILQLVLELFLELFLELILELVRADTTLGFGGATFCPIFV
jgi:hypothetical protein